MPFVKGQSGNPSGRAKTGESFAKVLARGLDEVRAGTTTRERIAAVVLALALKGNLDAAKWIVDRVDGKVPDRLEADVDARVAPALDPATRDRILDLAARRRGLERGA